MQDLNRKKLWRATIAAFIVVSFVFITLSYEDHRPADGALKIGYPLVFYTEIFNHFKGSEEASFDLINLGMDLSLYLIASGILGSIYYFSNVHLSGKLRKKR